jgi:hypothetical protein
MILDRAAFLAMNDIDTDTVPIPEAATGEDVPVVHVRSLTCDQRSRLMTRAELDDKAGAPAGSWRALCCAMGMVDDKGAYLFPNEAEGAVLLGKKHSDIVTRISDRILEMSALTKASRAAAEKKLSEAANSSGPISSAEPSTPVMDSTLHG